MWSSRIGRVRRRSPGITDVVFCVDPGFEVPLAVTLASLAQSQSSIDSLRVTVLALQVDRATKARLRAVVPGLDVRFIRIEKRLPADLPVMHHLTTASYGRLWAAEMLQSDCERFVYLDADVLVMEDLRTLAGLDLGGLAVAAVRDALIPTVSNELGVANWRALGLDGKTPYFNSGVLLVDTATWVQQDVARKVVTHVLDYRESLNLPDQDGVNAVLANQIVELPQRWNQQTALRRGGDNLTGVIPPDAIAEAMERPAIMHFSGPRKPWLPECTNPGSEVWLEMLRTTPYGDQFDARS